ncbi:MAG: hypothetical protein ACU836_08005 [Gammaproteobacteria bacterium]
MTPSSKNTERLTLHWTICAAMLILLGIYNVICHYWADYIRLDFPEDDRIMLRSILYLLAIIIFPLANLIRHVLLRLNQTMPGDKPAMARYLITVTVTQLLIETVSLFGLLMFVLGDDFNTLYIFSLLGVLGVYLHRPRQEELQGIVRALSER